MRIRINGTYKKIDCAWAIEVHVLGIAISSRQPLECFRLVEKQIKSSIEEEIECYFKVLDSGKLVLLLSDRPALINYIAERIKTHDLSNITFEPDL